MSEINTEINASMLLSFLERAERLTEEKKNLQEDIKELFQEAKGQGYDVKTLKVILKIRRLNPSDRQEQDYLLDVYKRAVGIE